MLPAVGHGADLLYPAGVVGRYDRHVRIPLGELLAAGGAAHHTDGGDLVVLGAGGEESTHRGVGGVVDDETVEADREVLLGGAVQQYSGQRIAHHLGSDVVADRVRHRYREFGGDVDELRPGSWVGEHGDAGANHRCADPGAGRNHDSGGFKPSHSTLARCGWDEGDADEVTRVNREGANLYLDLSGTRSRWIGDFGGR
jgi:hypothetical protein